MLERQLGDRMTKTDEVLALIRSHIDGDHQRFRGIALCIAANAADKSPKVAESIRRLLADDPDPDQRVMLPTHMGGLLTVSHPVVKLADMVLDVDTRSAIDRFLLEQKNGERLRGHGLTPARKLLFVGKPGVGKSMMAAALACALEVPMLRVELHGVIAKHLGETAAHLGKVFETVKTLRGVYLFDEFDALARDRDNSGDNVGEMKRAVNSLLQFLENDTSNSIIIAATNLHGILDRAMFRRFDQVVEFPMPTPEIAESLVRSRLLWTTGIDWAQVRRSVAGIGHADLTAACMHVNKDAVIANREQITTREVIAAITARRISERSPDVSS